MFLAPAATSDPAPARAELITSGTASESVSDGILIQNNYIHDLNQDTVSIRGMGIRVSAPIERGGATNVRIVGNRIERTANDGMEIGGLLGGLVEGNTVTRTYPVNSAEHADPFFLWAGSRDVIVRRNRFIDNQQPAYVGPDTYRITVEDNLIARARGSCMQVGNLGVSNAGTHDSVFRFNTMWECGLDAPSSYASIQSRGQGSGNVVTNNVFQRMSGDTNYPGQFRVEDYNVIPGGATFGSHDQRCTPVFVNPAAFDYRIKPGSSCPAGFQAGYR